MSTEYTSESENAELRRRAAWLLVMLVVFAALFVIVMVTFFNSSGNGSKPAADPTGGLSPTSSAAPSSTSPVKRPPAKQPPTTSATSPVAHGTASCPSPKPCVLAGDFGNGVAAINAYRTSHGQPAIPGTVSPAAQQCAVQNGNDCSGGWAETQLGQADGPQAVQKILPFGHLLDPAIKSIEVGWAWDPAAKQFYFAIVRND